MKKDLIILHGALGSSSQFENCVSYLEDSFNVILPDFPGHGMNEDISYPLTIDLCASYLQDQMKSYPNAAIFGYSMGGYVALWALASKLIKPTSVMTLATKFEWSPAFAEKETMMMEVNNLRNIAPAFIDSLIRQHGEKWNSLLDKTKDMMTSLGNHVLLTESKLAEIDIPICISVGFKDKMVSIEESLWAARHIPKAELEVFPKLQHPAERINWEQVAFSIKTILY